MAAAIPAASPVFRQQAMMRPLGKHFLVDIPDHEAVRGGLHSATVPWNSDASLTGYAGKPVRLKVELNDAYLFAMRFVEK